MVTAGFYSPRRRCAQNVWFGRFHARFAPLYIPIADTKGDPSQSRYSFTHLLLLCSTSCTFTFTIPFVDVMTSSEMWYSIEKVTLCGRFSNQACFLWLFWNKNSSKWSCISLAIISLPIMSLAIFPLPLFRLPLQCLSDMDIRPWPSVNNHISTRPFNPNF